MEDNIMMAPEMVEQAVEAVETVATSVAEAAAPVIIPTTTIVPVTPEPVAVPAKSGKAKNILTNVGSFTGGMAVGAVLDRFVFPKIEDGLARVLFRSHRKREERKAMKEARKAEKQRKTAEQRPATTPQPKAQVTEIDPLQVDCSIDD